MALFEWQRIYSVGNTYIDNQHKILFDIANRFHEAYQQRRGYSALTRIFNELIEYTQMHFAEEEQIMREKGYPDYAYHKQNHDKLVGLVSLYKEQFERKEPGIERRAMDFIQIWLNGHILGMDRSYKPYLQTGQNKQANVTAHIAPISGQTPLRKPMLVQK